MMNFAICDWVPNLTDEVLATWQRDGVTAMEPGPAFLLRTEKPKLKSDVERLHSHGIRIYSCHAPFGGQDDLSQIDEDGRKSAVDSHVAALERATMAGAGCVVIHPSSSVTREEQEPRLGQLRKSLGALIHKAQAIGVKLALENMPPGLLCYQADSLIELVNEFDSPFLGICFDTGHANIGESDANAVFEVLRERIITFHLHDNDGHGDRHLQPPYGTINWESLATSIRDMAFEHPIAIEAPPWGGVSFGLQLRELTALFCDQLLKTNVGDKSARVICDRCRRYCFGTKEDFFCGCEGEQ